MTRVATFGNYQSALLDLMSAQSRAADAQERISTQKNATDLTGFGRQSETLTALKGTQSRIQGFIDTSNTVSARLDAQDLAMTQIVGAIASIRESVGNAVATDSSGAVMQELEGQFQAIRGGLNMSHQGSYLFSGASSSTPPVAATNMSDVLAAPTIASLFVNDTLKSVSRVAESTTLETGFLANDLGAEIMGILRDVQAFHTTPGSGPFTGKLTLAQKDFLTIQLGRLEKASSAMIDHTAKNGSMSKQVEGITASHTAQKTTLDELVSGHTDADMAVAVTDLELSQVAIQASAQIISQLRQASLLNYLR